MFRKKEDDLTCRLVRYKFNIDKQATERADGFEIITQTQQKCHTYVEVYNLSYMNTT